jgi:hypothetical protein
LQLLLLLALELLVLELLELELLLLLLLLLELPLVTLVHLALVHVTLVHVPLMHVPLAHVPLVHVPVVSSLSSLLQNRLWCTIGLTIWHTVRTVVACVHCAFPKFFRPLVRNIMELLHQYLFNFLNIFLINPQ